jgi:hypothetical protein
MHADQLSERGTTTAILEYSRFLKTRGIECSIAFDKKHSSNNLKTISEVSKEFETIGYKNFRDIRSSEKKFDLGYFIKAGVNDRKMFKTTPSIIHSVFQEYEPHGDLYLYVSKWLAETMRSREIFGKHAGIHNCRTKNCFEFEYLAHTVELPKALKNLRISLEIPSNSLVGIRYGGKDTFDIPWAQQAVADLIKSNEDIYFVFTNTQKFLDHNRAFFLDSVYSAQDKADFLATGDFFLHARKQGESFGLSILEAAIAKIPVLTYSGGLDLNHLNLVPRALVYSDYESLMKIISEKTYSYDGEFYDDLIKSHKRDFVGEKLMTYIARIV